MLVAALFALGAASFVGLFGGPDLLGATWTVLWAIVMGTWFSLELRDRKSRGVPEQGVPKRMWLGIAVAAVAGLIGVLERAGVIA